MRVAMMIMHTYANCGMSVGSVSTMNAHPPGNHSTSILLEHRERRGRADSVHGEATCIVNASALHLLSGVNRTCFKSQQAFTSPRVTSPGKHWPEKRRPGAVHKNAGNTFPQILPRSGN